MQRLNQNTLTTAAAKTKNATKDFYNRDNIQPGIVHFGVGNFHRCHQAVYVDKLLSLGGLDWGIMGVSMRSGKIRDQLAPQDFLYTVVTLSKDIELSIIGSILNILVAPENPAVVINQVADNNIKLVTTTITEKGYCLSSGQIDNEHRDFIADSASLETPRTIYGYLAAAIIQRRKNGRHCKHGGAPLSVLCCDNIQSGGEHLQAGVQRLLQHHDQVSKDWAKIHVSFASSMVDRVAPKTDESLKQLVHAALELEDAWPVSAEPFSQWVIEDRFAGERPAFDKVGALFTDDISLFEQMKLRFLNAGHSIISILGYLDNQATVHQALEQPSILDFVQKALHENVLPVATLPTDFKGEGYISDVIQRFRNSALPYTVQQVNTDSSQKIQQRWFPTIDDALAQYADSALMSFMVAAWAIYVHKALDAGELNDPLRDDFLAAQRQGEDIVSQFLLIAGADRFGFYNSTPFMAAVLSDYNTLQNTEITTALTQFLSRREEATHA
ncbi:MAG: mannitol dehydrogenase family protein [Pseudomonadales bacterium]